MSQLEATMAWQIKAERLPVPVVEHQFHPHRKWRFDFAWPDKMIALECEGGVWANGRHTRGSGFTEDCTKYNEAAKLGWLVFRVTSDHIKNGEAVQWMREVLL